MRVSLTAVSPSQQESEAALASLTTEEGQHRGCTKQQAVPSGGAHRRQLETDGDVEELEARVAEKEAEQIEALLEKALQDLASVDADALNGCQGKDVIFKIGPREMPFTAEGFLLSFSKPNAYFHATTAYNILRMQGVPLGKRDYMGQMQLKA